MNYKQIGDVGQNCAIGDLSKYGLGIAFPLSDNYPFDFIVIAGKKLFRVQVKTSSQILNGAVMFGLTTNNFYSGGNKTAYNRNEIDVFVCYDLTRNVSYLFTHKEIDGRKTINIRFVQAKNNQKCHRHEDFVLSKERVKEVFDFDPPDFSQFFAKMKSTQYPHICEKCGKSFSNGNRNAKFCGKICKGFSQRRIAERPSKEELEKEIKETSWTDLGKKYKVTDNAVKKWARNYGIVFSPKKCQKLEAIDFKGT